MHGGYRVAWLDDGGWEELELVDSMVDCSSLVEAR
jgi:hypothetical protein